VSSLRARLLSALIRRFEKPRLARAEDPLAERRRLEAGAALFLAPRGSRFTEDRLGGLRALRCRGPVAAEGRTILYLHGGAFIMGSPETHRHLAAALAAAARAEAWVPDYGLAPERPFPGAVEDAVAAWRALLDRGVDPARCAFAGDSAGGGLVFAALHALRAERLPDPARLVAFSPWCDMTGEAEALARNAEADCLLPASRFHDLLDWVLAGADPRDPRASPARARFDRPTPLALLFASRSEILADDAAAMTERLRASGGPAQLVWSEDLPHAWPLFRGWIPEADDAIGLAGAFIRAGLPAD